MNNLIQEQEQQEIQFDEAIPAPQLTIAPGASVVIESGRSVGSLFSPLTINLEEEATLVLGPNSEIHGLAGEIHESARIIGYEIQVHMAGLENQIEYPE